MLKKIIKYNELVSIENLSINGHLDIEIDQINKIEISKRLDLIKLDIFEMTINYSQVSKIESLAKYTLNSVGEQKCVISLNPVKFKINKSFNIKFVNNKKLDLSVLDDEFIEPIYNNQINFGEVGTQIFASFLDVYPKIDNGDINLNSKYSNEDDSKVNKKNPFEVLNNINK
jgi:uncharacterized metal-binding protein YceD (DUF177 family)